MPLSVSWLLNNLATASYRNGWIYDIDNYRRNLKKHEYTMASQSCHHFWQLLVYIDHVFLENNHPMTKWTFAPGFAESERERTRRGGRRRINAVIIFHLFWASSFIYRWHLLFVFEHDRNALGVYRALRGSIYRNWTRESIAWSWIVLHDIYDPVLIQEAIESGVLASGFVLPLIYW